MPRAATACVERGTLNKRVRVQTVTEARDAAGGVTQTWSTVRSVWASIEPIGGREYLNAQQTQSQVTHRVRMRWFAGLNPKQRLLYTDKANTERTLQIERVINIQETSETYEVMCVEKTT